MEMNENRPVAVRLSGVKKMYKLGQIGGGTLTADLQSWWARVRGKEDPNTKIGTDQRLIGKTFMALNGVDLTIYQGEAVGIIGGNGAGKSTMLKLLSRVTAPTEGEIDIYGRITSMLEVGTGFNGEMTGRENVYLNGAILGMTKAEIDAKMEDIIEFSEVREFIDTPVKRYSSGMYVKLAFSVAAHLDSEIMIMDEVLAVGDANFQQKCLKRMREAAKEEGRTVLYVSHNMGTIRKLCDRCIVLNQGKVVFEGDVENAIAVYSNSKQFEFLSSNDISHFPRLGSRTDKYHMSRVSLPKTFLVEQETLNFDIAFDSQEKSDNVVFRIIVSNRFGAVGTTFSPYFSAVPGENIVRFVLDATILAPGDYMVSIVLSEIDDDIQIRHDAVEDAFSFRIEEHIPMHNLKWSREYWGDTRIPPLTIVPTERK